MSFKIIINLKILTLFIHKYVLNSFRQALYFNKMGIIYNPKDINFVIYFNFKEVLINFACFKMNINKY